VAHGCAQALYTVDETLLTQNFYLERTAPVRSGQALGVKTAVFAVSGYGRHVQLRRSLGLNLFHRYARGELDELQAFCGDFEHAQVGDDEVNDSHTGKRKRAFRQNLEIFSA